MMARIPKPTVNYVGRDDLAMKVTCPICGWLTASFDWDAAEAAYAAHARLQHSSRPQGERA